VLSPESDLLTARPVSNAFDHDGEATALFRNERNSRRVAVPSRSVVSSPAWLSERTAGI